MAMFRRKCQTLPTPVKKGVLTQRTEKQVRELVLKGSPATQLVGEECQEDMTVNRRSSALESIEEAEDESELNEDGDHTHRESKMYSYLF